MRRLGTLLVLLTLAATPASAAPESWESLTDFEARWRQFRLDLADLDREERLAEAARFFESVPWEQVRFYCSGEAGPDLSNFLGGMVETKLRFQPVNLGVLADLVGDADTDAGCQRAAVKFIFVHADSFAALPGVSHLARAFLDLADSGKRSAKIGRELERGAAALWAGDELMRRMMSHGRAGEFRETKHGVKMLAGSCDPRATDSLAVLCHELADEGGYDRTVGFGLQRLSEKTGGEHFDFFVELAEESADDPIGELHRAALSAIGGSGDPRAYPILLAEYDDEETGIVAATGEIADRDLRSRYWSLWFAVRLAEPGMIEVLGTGDPVAVQAVELLDRASRFGLPDTREEICLALEAWGERRGGGWQERISLIVNRFRSYPDPRQ